MRRAIIWLLAAAVGFGLAQAASAADMPVKAPAHMAAPAPVYNWTGMYVGANVGYGWGDNDATLGPSPDTYSQTFWNGAFAAGAAPSGFGFRQSGIIGGIGIGYNYQLNALVLGVETDFQGANVDDTITTATSGVPGFVSGAFSSSQDLRWLGTVRGRIGYAWDRVLLYATGGFAYGRVDYDLNFAFSATNDFHTISASRTETGWTVGGGVEWAHWDHWSVKLEYLYVDLGDTSLVSTPSGRATNLLSTLTEDFQNRYSIVRLGVNYKF